jgi:hypothetical protein
MSFRDRLAMRVIGRAADQALLDLEAGIRFFSFMAAMIFFTSAMASGPMPSPGRSVTAQEIGGRGQGSIFVTKISGCRRHISAHCRGGTVCVPISPCIAPTGLPAQ